MAVKFITVDCCGLLLHSGFYRGGKVAMVERGMLPNELGSSPSEYSLTFRAGDPITAEQLACAVEGMKSASQPISRVNDIYRRLADDPAMVKEVADVLDNFSDFAEGSITSTDRRILFRAAPSKWDAGKASTNWRGITTKLYEACGLSADGDPTFDPVLRNDGGPNGCRVTAGVWGNRQFFFIESVVPARGRNVARKLEVVSAGYKGVVAAVNEYSHDERMAAANVLDGLLASMEMSDDEKRSAKAEVLRDANRILAPTHAELASYLNKVRNAPAPKRTMALWLGGLMSRRSRVNSKGPTMQAA